MTNSRAQSGAGSYLTGGNFWEGAVTGMIVSGFNHFYHQQQIKNEIEDKYPGLYKVLKKLKPYVKDHPSVLDSFTLYSGYTNEEALDLLSLYKLTKIVLVGGTNELGEFFHKDPTHVHISSNIVSSIEKGFYSDVLGGYETLSGISFLGGVTILHELVHYGRYWNNLSSKVGIFEAGQMFEKRTFGIVTGVTGSTQNSKIYDWKF